MFWVFFSCQSILYPLIEPAVQLPASNLLAFHSCDTRIKDCFDPMLHEIKLAYSEDGSDWNIWNSLPQISGSVPDVLIRDSILYIYSLPELHRLDLVSGSWLPTARAHVFDDKGNMVIHVDPSPVLDENNNIVLFFLKGVPGIDPATCGLTERTCTKKFLSATELSGSARANASEENPELQKTCREEDEARWKQRAEHYFDALLNMGEARVASTS